MCGRERERDFRIESAVVCGRVEQVSVGTRPPTTLFCRIVLLPTIAHCVSYRKYIPCIRRFMRAVRPRHARRPPMAISPRASRPFRRLTVRVGPGSLALCRCAPGRVRSLASCRFRSLAPRSFVRSSARQGRPRRRWWRALPRGTRRICTRTRPR